MTVMDGHLGLVRLIKKEIEKIRWKSIWESLNPLSSNKRYCVLEGMWCLKEGKFGSKRKDFWFYKKAHDYAYKTAWDYAGYFDGNINDGPPYAYVEMYNTWQKEVPLFKWTAGTKK